MWAKIKRYSGWVGAVLLAILTLGAVWRFHKRRVGQLKDKAKVEKARTAIAGLKARRERLAENATENAEEIAVADLGLAMNKRELIEAHEGGEGWTDDEVLAEADRLGY